VFERSAPTRNLEHAEYIPQVCFCKKKTKNRVTGFKKTNDMNEIFKSFCGFSFLFPGYNRRAA
jgi:hypothetical protein